MNTPTKRCSKCGKKFPATTEFFNVDRRLKSGIRSDCKSCQRNAHLRWRQGNPDKVRENNRRWAQENRERKNAYLRRWKKENRDRVRKSAQRYRISHREVVRAKDKRWRDNNLEQVRAKVRRYQLAHPEKCRMYSHNSRARKRGAEGFYTQDDIKVLYERQKGCCYYCDYKFDADYEIDHVVPLSRGGTNWPSNLVLACKACNSSKRDKMPHEWPDGGRLL